MSKLDSKEQVIHDIYFDTDEGFGNLKETYTKAKQKDKSITYGDVRKYINNLEHKQTQFKYDDYNSWISKHAKYEFEIDLIDMTQSAEENEGYRYALSAFDNFSKKASVIPIKKKLPDDIVMAFKKVMDEMGIPKQIYSDDEGSFSSKLFIQLLNKHNIKHIITSFASGVERFNRTVKSKTIERLKALKLKRFEWVDQLPAVIKKYNNTPTSTLQTSPNDASKKENELYVKLMLDRNIKSDRLYPKLSVNDMVRVKVKKKITSKSWDLKWSEDVFKVIHIKDEQYLLNNGLKRVYIRADLLKVE